jgi:hypothetical protein
VPKPELFATNLAREEFTFTLDQVETWLKEH